MKNAEVLNKTRQDIVNLAGQYAAASEFRDEAVAHFTNDLLVDMAAIMDIKLALPRVPSTYPEFGVEPRAQWGPDRLHVNRFQRKTTLEDKQRIEWRTGPDESEPSR